MRSRESPVLLVVGVVLLLGAGAAATATVVDFDGGGADPSADVDENGEPAVGSDATTTQESATTTVRESVTTTEQGTTTVAQTATTTVDSDGDGLTDERERAIGTDPRVADSDGDGLVDGAEVEEYGTDPLVADTDGDGLDDAAEVEEYGTSPTDADSDGDRFDDGREVAAGTDPTDADTDDDGLGDGVEAADSGPLADADPLRRDVFVELDYMRGEKPDADAISLVVDRFADAPVENPDGSTGISLHVVVDDAIPRESETAAFDMVRLRTTHFDNGGRGYHHAVAVADARSDGESVIGFAATGSFVFQTSGQDDDAFTTRGQAHVLMHELGHSVGLVATSYVGIDSRSVSYSTYESAMNYNSPWESVRYSDGGAFDDWAFIEANLYTPPILPWELPGPEDGNATGASTSRQRGPDDTVLTF